MNKTYLVKKIKSIKMVRHEKTFYLNNGKTINSLKALAKELMTITNEAYEHHVTLHKNDFANWVRHSLKKEKLADKLEKRIEKVEVELEILRHLVHEKEKNVKNNARKVQKVIKEKTQTAIKKVATKKAKKK